MDMGQSNKIVPSLRPYNSSVSVLSVCLSIIKSWEKGFCLFVFFIFFYFLLTANITSMWFSFSFQFLSIQRGMCF